MRAAPAPPLWESVREEELWPHPRAAWSRFLPCPPCWGQPCRLGAADGQGQHPGGVPGPAVLDCATEHCHPAGFSFCFSSSLPFLLLSFSFLPTCKRVSVLLGWTGVGLKPTTAKSHVPLQQSCPIWRQRREVAWEKPGNKQGAQKAAHWNPHRR